jgi:hypothetical protein
VSPPVRRRCPHTSRAARRSRRYQTVYARGGSAAAPTAAPLPPDRSRADVRQVTLHVGLDTFRRSRWTTGDHRLHGERYEVSAKPGSGSGGAAWSRRDNDCPRPRDPRPWAQLAGHRPLHHAGLSSGAWTRC